MKEPTPAGFASVPRPSSEWSQKSGGEYEQDLHSGWGEAEAGLRRGFG
jgi:hypothetical protein